VQIFQSHQLWKNTPMDAETAVIYECRAQNEAIQASYTLGKYLGRPTIKRKQRIAQ
jgi:hypothetical protein